LTVTGTEQRVYGTLIADNCNINIRRFAIVMDDMDKSPIQSSNVVYADAVPMTQTGYKYSGYITLFMYQDTGDVYAAIEVRICKTDQKTIIIDSYGEIELPASEIYEGVSLWFDKNNTKYFASQDDFPETGSINVTYVDGSTGHSYIWTGASYTAGNGWTKLNDAMYGSKMNHFKTTFDKFKEDGKTGLTTINCCKNCPDECTNNCEIDVIARGYYYLACISGFEKITLFLYPDLGFSSIQHIPYGINNYGYKTVYFPDHNICIEYKIEFDDDFLLKAWIYPKSPIIEMRYIDIFIRITSHSYKHNKYFRISGFLSDFKDHENIFTPLVYTGYVTMTSSEPVITIDDPYYVTLFNKTIKINSEWFPEQYSQYAKIVNIEKDLNNRYVVYIDPETIVSSHPTKSHEIRPIIDGDFELSKICYASDTIASFLVVESEDIPLRDLYRDLDMTIEFTDLGGNIIKNVLSSYKPIYWGIIFEEGTFPNYLEILEMTDITPNEDYSKYTVRWRGSMQNDYAYNTSLTPQGICIRINYFYPCIVKITGNIRWYTSTGREIHYGDKGLYTSIFPECERYTNYRSPIHIIS